MQIYAHSRISFVRCAQLYAIIHLDKLLLLCMILNERMQIWRNILWNRRFLLILFQLRHYEDLGKNLVRYTIGGHSILYNAAKTISCIPISSSEELSHFSNYQDQGWAHDTIYVEHPLIKHLLLPESDSKDILLREVVADISIIIVCYLQINGGYPSKSPRICLASSIAWQYGINPIIIFSFRNGCIISSFFRSCHSRITSRRASSFNRYSPFVVSKSFDWICLRFNRETANLSHKGDLSSRQTPKDPDADADDIRLHSDYPLGEIRRFSADG